MDLDQLEAVAKAATPGPWVAVNNVYGGRAEFWCEWHKVGPLTLPSRNLNKDTAYIAAMSPDVGLALIAVARAAEDHVDSLDGYPEQLVPINRSGGTVQALRAALSALSGKGSVEHG